MKKWLRPLAALALLSILVIPMGARSGALNVKNYVLFNGVNVADSSERASIWIPIRGATRIYIRTWSAGATADTDFCDTITTWKTMFSDSALFTGRDSLGTLVTSRTSPSYNPTIYGSTFPVCADSIVLTNNAADSVKMVVCLNPVQGVGKPVRGTTSASGYWTIIAPTAIPMSGINFPSTFANAPPLASPDVIMPGYMRIRITPRTRLTTAGFSSTAGTRTRGLNRLRMEAWVLYPNQ